MFRWPALLFLGLASYWAGRLAWLDKTAGDADSLAGLQQAAATDPENPRRFERLGQQAELAGDLVLAEQSLLRAARLSRLYQPRYLLAQYYFRRTDVNAWTKWSQEAFAVAHGDVLPLVDLARRMAPDADTLANQGLGQRPFIGRQFLLFLVRNRETRAASTLARHLAETGGPPDRPALLGYCEQSLADADLTNALTVWRTLCRRKLLPYEDNLPVTNGDFRQRTVSSGFDWHIEPPARQSGSALHLAAASAPGEAAIAWQYAPVQRGARYRLRYEVQGASEGVGWSIYYPANGGWSEWLPARTLDFQAPSELIRLVLVRRRPLESPVSVTAVRLEREP